MKKTRYIPYGYAMRNGRIEVDTAEASVIREIFDHYVGGLSLKEIADSLTARQIPYTEKSTVWDKARIARIIENSKYTGDGEYDPIVAEQTYEYAVAAKNARKRGESHIDGLAVGFLRSRVRCEACGCPMVRGYRAKAAIPESWKCQNPLCGRRVRISDHQLVEKTVILVNRIIENGDLLIPIPKERYQDSQRVAELNNQVLQELAHPYPSEDRVIQMVSEISQQIYAESNARQTILARVARKRASMMQPSEQFDQNAFQELVSYLTLDMDGKVTLHTVTETKISEGAS